MGPIVGAFVLTFGIEYMRAFGNYRMLFYGGLIMLSIMFFPNGLASIKIPLPKLGNFLFRRPVKTEVILS